MYLSDHTFYVTYLDKKSNVTVVTRHGRNEILRGGHGGKSPRFLVLTIRRK